MKIIKDLCKILDCHGTKIIYNGFDNTITEFDSKLEETLNNENSIYFKEYSIEILCEYDIENVRLKSNSMLRHAIISLTENCNLRCKYCAYHDVRFTNTNPLNDMSEATLKSALDFISTHSADSYETTVSFYGGESLLQLDKIKYAVEYLEKKNWRGQKYNFRITTNGTLLEAEVVDYLVSKDIMCVISLDGPVFIHDRYRVYKEGSPTYADIIGNIKNIAGKYPKYYKKNISFNTVMSPPNNRPVPSDYFGKSDVFFIDVTVGDYFRELLRNEHGIEFERNSEVTPIQRIDMGTQEVLQNWDYLSSLKKFMHVGEKNKRKSIFPSGFCPPLERRIHIGVDGKIMLCERADENNPLFHLGDVFTGYDFEKMDLLYKHTYSILKGNCDKCWAFRFCTTCFIHLGEVEYNGDYCKSIRKTTEQDLVNFLEFKYSNRRFDEVMQSISVD